LLDRIKDTEKELLQAHQSSLTQGLVADFDQRQGRAERHIDAALQANEVKLTNQIQAGRDILADKLESALHEIRVLNFRLNAIAEPRSPEGLFRALQEESLHDTLTIIKNEMPEAMHVLEHRHLLRFAIGSAGDGVVLEFGVFSGITINWMAEDFPGRKIFGFDSFEGLPEAWSGHELFDFNRGGTPPDVLPNVTLVKGLFSETLPAFSDALNEEIAVFHVDCDIYSSTKTIFDVLGSRLKDGCIIIFDEYFNYPGFEKHERKAFAEFMQRENCSVEWLAFCGQRTVGRLKRGA
jgi:predicted O-methyltransferase YrrM